MSIVRDNLMNKKGYSPYCGEFSKCSMPRAPFNGNQFECPECGWQSGFEKEFINEYKAKWGKDNVQKNLCFYVYTISLDAIYMGLR